jgi:hypothetical protein
MRVLVPWDALQDGDELVELQKIDKAGRVLTVNVSWAGMHLKNGILYWPDGSVWGSGKPPIWSEGYHYVVLRPDVAPRVAPSMPLPAKGPKVIEDWPIKCPRCKRDKAAVLLLNDYDCKHGCFSRMAGRAS